MGSAGRKRDGHRKLARGLKTVAWVPMSGGAHPDPAGNRAQRRRAKQLGITETPQPVREDAADG